MYCKRTYDPQTSKLEKGRFQCTTSYVHEDKEILYTAFYARMQENHNPNCLDCQRCVSGKNSYVYPTRKNFCYSEEWNERPLRETYCTDCSGRSRMQNVVYEDELHSCDIPVDKQENYVPVCNTKRRFAKGSMYGCDQIDVDEVSFCKDENSSGRSYVSQRPENTSGSTQAEFENCSANQTWTSQNSEKCQSGSDAKARQTDPPNRMSRGFRSDKTYHKSDDVKCSEKAGSGSETKRKIPGKEERKSSVKVTNEEKVKENNFGKNDTVDTGSKRAKKDETFQHKDTSKSKQPASVKTDEEASKHDAADGRDRTKVPKASKKIPRRRPQRKPHAQHSRDSEKPASRGVDEWLLFVFLFFRKGVVLALSWSWPYLKIGWSSLMYLLLVILLLVLLVLSWIWTLTKSFLLYIWDVLCSLREKIFEKQQQNSPETSEQQPRHCAATRQRSEPLPEADELVDRLLASKELNAYEVLGVLPTATDEEIKRNYRDMAKLVHPDKNAHEDASEAFQILQSAFEAVGDEEKRMAYQFDNDKKRFQEEFHDFFDMFMERVQEMKNRIMCRVCRKSHPRLLTDRLISAARYCADCGVRHPAEEGDVWIETSHMGFKYYCFLCAEGQVYEVTEWGSCQGLLQRKANSHITFMSVRSNHQPSWFDMYGDSDRSKTSSNNKKKRKSKGKPNKNKKR